MDSIIVQRVSTVRRFESSVGSEDVDSQQLSITSFLREAEVSAVYRSERRDQSEKTWINFCSQHRRHV